MTPFEKIVEYAGKFDPKFPETIEGAFPNQIEELRSLLSAPIPELYEDFLQIMGRNTDWIKVQELDFGIERVLDYYRKERWLPADQFIRIGSDNHVVELNPFLEVDILGEHKVVRYPPFVREEFKEIYILKQDPLAGSLVELFAMPVFKMFELRAGGRIPVCLLTEEWEAEALRKLEQTARPLGFEKLWFSSETGHAYRRDDGTAIHANQWVGYPLQIFVSAESESQSAGVVDELLKKLSPIKRMS